MQKVIIVSIVDPDCDFWHYYEMAGQELGVIFEITRAQPHNFREICSFLLDDSLNRNSFYFVEVLPTAFGKTAAQLNEISTILFDKGYRTGRMFRNPIYLDSIPETHKRDWPFTFTIDDALETTTDIVKFLSRNFDRAKK